MPYEKQIWEENVSYADQIRLNHMEAGIAGAYPSKEAPFVPKVGEERYLPVEWDGREWIPTTKFVNFDGTRNVKDFGARGDNATDDTQAIQAAINSLPQGTNPNGGIILFPPGIYICEGELNVKGLTGITLKGCATIDGGGGFGGISGSTTQIIYNEKAGARFFDARNGYGFSIEGIQIFSTNKAFSGITLDLSGAQFPYLVHTSIQIGGLAPISTAVVGMQLAVGNSGTFIKCKFAGNQYGIKGKTEEGQFSNVHSFIGCVFGANQAAHIVNPGYYWSFSGCSFETRRDNTGKDLGAGAIKTAYGNCKDMNFLGCWFGANGTEEGQQIQYAGEGLNIIGGTMNGAETLVDLVGVTHGVNIIGTEMTKAKNGLKLGFAGNSRVVYRPSSENEIENAIVNHGNAKGSILTEGEGEGFKPIAEPVETTAGNTAAIKSILKTMKSLGQIE